MNKKILFPLLLFSFGLYLLAGYFWYEHQRPTGDEPHYLIIAQSIVSDRDLDLKNNYDNLDYQKWGYPDEILNKHISINSRVPHQYSIHNIGWSLFFSPFFSLGGRLAIKVLTGIIATFLLLNIYLLIFKKMKSNLLAIISSAIIGFSPPVLIYSTQIFNEIFTALLILYSFRKIIEKPQKWYEILLPIIAISYLPWLHVKYLLISFVLILLLSLNYFHDKKRLSFISIYFVSLGLMSYFFWLWYASPLPNAQYPTEMTLNIIKIAQGGLALIFDQTFGLIPYVPIYIFTIPGLYFLFKDDKSTFWKLSIVFLSLFLIQAAGAFYIGWAPAGRFITPVLPLLALSIAYAYKNLRMWSKGIFWILVLWGWFAGYYLIRHPDINYSLSKPIFLEKISHNYFDLTIIFPKLLEVERYVNPNYHSIVSLISWLTIIIVLTFIIIKQSHIKSKQY